MEKSNVRKQVHNDIQLAVRLMRDRLDEVLDNPSLMLEHYPDHHPLPSLLFCALCDEVKEKFLPAHTNLEQVEMLRLNVFTPQS